MKQLLTLLLLTLCTHAFAVPARRVKKAITLADGSRKEVVLRGDEMAHYLEAKDGSLYREDEAGRFHTIQLADAKEQRATRLRQRSLTRSQQQKVQRRIPSTRIAGKKKGLVILVNFDDRKLTISKDEFNNYFNQTGYTNQGNAGSVHDYFWDCSYGQFDLSFDVIGPVDVSKSIQYYGKNNSSGDDLHPAEMVIEAVQLAAKQNIDFHDYDWDNDGEVDQVYVIYAGYGEASGAPTFTIWPHEYDLESAKYFGDGTGPITINGVKINTYACSNELYGTSSKKVDGIGTACHEFSHCLGLPDMYDTRGICFGMSYWDVMDYGCYCGDGYCPTGYTSYERWFCGWLTPIELNEGCDVKDMPSLNSSPTAYVIYNEKYPNEYYLLENRQKDGWYKYDYSHGLMITHVDYDKTAWEDNTVNNVTSHQRMTLIPADNSLSDLKNTDLEGDLWPGTKKNTALTNTSTPAAKLFHNNMDGKKLMNKPIENITEDVNKGTVSFTFNGGDPLDTPQQIEISDLLPTGFTATWQPIAEAGTYEIELKGTDKSLPDVPETEVLLEENFDGFKYGDMTGTYDIGEEMDEYTLMPGWTGEKVFTTTSGEAKIGTTKVAGKITTPKLLATTGIATIIFTLRPYNNDNTSVFLNLNGKEIDEIALTEGDKVYTYEVSAKSEFTVNLTACKATNCRFYISDLKIYDGSLKGTESGKSSINTRATVAETIAYYETTNCSYTFKDLNPDLRYALRIRAKNDEKESVWTKKISITLPVTEETEPDALQNIGISQTTNHIYNLQGQAIDPANMPQKGIYLKDGRKVIK